MHFKMTRVNVNILFTQIIFHHFKVASLKCISVHSIKNMSNHDEFPITFVLRLTGCVRVIFVSLEFTTAYLHTSKMYFKMVFTLKILYFTKKLQRNGK